MGKSVFYLTFLVASVSAFAGEFSLVAVTSYSPAVYKGQGTNVEQFALLGYEGRHLYVRGTSAGYSLNPLGSPLNLILGVGYDPRTLHPEKSSNVDVQQLDQRKAGVFGRVSLQAISQAGELEVSIGTDLANNHNGLYVEAVLRLPVSKELHTFVPEIGYSYNSKKLNNHLYGVSYNESRKTDFDSFDAGSNGAFFIGLNTQFRLYRQVTIFSSVRYSNLDSGISQSPVIESSRAISAVVGFSYTL
ncbi:MipA/OmpV family protein [Photobacterium alginatilyticum]|uniref:MipA/OmpV family protein n=1 Tax=Photobacterium alginatilyticum TaxID=1775171 RepID=UPI0040675A3D